MEKILRNIKTQIWFNLNYDLNYDYSLLGGKFGQVLYLILSSMNNPNEYNKANEYLDKVLSSLKHSPLNLSYCNGLAGFCTGLLALEESGCIENVKETVGAYDRLLCHHFNNLLKYNLDFLHGAIGIGIYLVKRAVYDDYVKNTLITALENLEMRVKTGYKDGLFWLYPNRYGKLELNLSISHGLCSTAIFLARIYNNIKYQEVQLKCKKLLQGIGHFLRYSLIDPHLYGCFTPMNGSGGKSRLGWCYGDIGTSIALRAIGEILQDHELLNLSYEIAVYTARYRNDLKSDWIYDACLCHGSSGIAHFFHNCFSYYNDCEFSKAYDRWVRITIDMYKIYDGVEMFGTYRYHNHKIQKCLDILEGDSGVGLLLMREFNLLDNLLLYTY